MDEQLKHHLENQKKVNFFLRHVDISGLIDRHYFIVSSFFCLYIILFFNALID